MDNQWRFDVDIAWDVSMEEASSAVLVRHHEGWMHQNRMGINGQGRLYPSS